MHRFLPLAIVALFMLSPTHGAAQHKGGTGSTAEKGKGKAVAEYDDAIETIATSTDRDAVHAADARLRQGGLPAIRALVRHITDPRRPPSNYLTRAVSGDVDMGDHSFWLIQDILESHTSKMDYLYSPLEKESIGKWLAERDGMSLAQLRREACIGAFEKILAMSRRHADFDASPVLRDYAERLVKLNNAVYGDG